MVVTFATAAVLAACSGAGPAEPQARSAATGTASESPAPRMQAPSGAATTTDPLPSSPVGPADPGPVAPSPPAGFWRLTSPPAGYQRPVVADYSTADTRIVQYLPAGTQGFGQRITVQATEQTEGQLTEGYTVLGTTTVRKGLPATHFRIGAGSGARQAVTWQEAGVRLAVYAYADLAMLRSLAGQVAPCGTSGC